jgi:hypothetical protein
MKLLRIINHFTNNYYRPSNLISNKITTWKFRSLLQKKIDPLIISRIVPDKPLIKGSSIKKVRSFYTAGNLKLQEEFGLKLEKHGYLVKETKPPSV